MIRALGMDRAHRNGDAAREPAAPDRDQHGGQIRDVLGDLEPEGALARDDPVVVVRRDEYEAALADELPGHGLALAARRTDGHDLGPVCLHPAALDRRRVRGHDDHGGGPEQSRRARDSLGVVPRRVRHHAACPLARRERGDGVVRAADLERADGLQRLGLQQDSRGTPGDRPERHQRRPQRHAGEIRCCTPDVLERDERRIRVVRGAGHFVQRSCVGRHRAPMRHRAPFRAQSMQVGAHGIASSRSGAIGLPQLSQTP